MKKISFLLTVTLLCSAAVAQPVRKQFAYELREGDTRPKPNLKPALLSPSPKTLGKGSNNAPGWQPNGISVCDTAPSALPKIVTDDKSGAIICWTECYRDQVSLDDDIYAQRVDSGGNFVWPSQGVPVCSLKGSYSNYPAMIADGFGGAIIAWEDSRGGLGYTRVFAQRLDSLGNRLWPENGVLVCNQMSGYVDICSDGQGGAIIAYVDGRDAATSDNIYAQRIDSAGNPVWPADGVPVCTADSIQFWLAIIDNEKDEAIIAWQDYRSGNYDIYAQMVDAMGNLKWTVNGIEVHTPTLQHERYPKNVKNNKGGAIISWIDYGNGKTYTQSVDSTGKKLWNSLGINTLGTYGVIKPILFGGGVSNSYAAQRIDSLGNIRWGSGILLHGDTTGGQFGAASDTFNNLFVIWDEMRNSPFYSDQYVQKIDSSGNLIWNPTGIPVCTLKMEYETYPQITGDGLGGAICTWFGNPIHSDNHIYVQRIYSSGIPGGIAGEPFLPSEYIIQYLKVWPNPFTTAINLNYTLPYKTKVSLRIYNITGQLVRNLSEEEKHGGSYTVPWDGKNNQGVDMPSGLYIVCLKVNWKTETRKTLKLK